MFIDARQLEQGTVIQTTVCVIGGGAAGLTLALEFEKRGIDACVLESGGFSADDQNKDLYRGENAGLPYTFADECRSRFLGGSSNCWGGWCRPFDKWDFEKRSWIPDSGWPFDFHELEPYYEKALKTLKLGPMNFDPAHWEAAINRSDVRRIPLVTGKVVDTISQFSPPVRFGMDYGDDLRRARRVTVYLYANVIDIEADASVQTVSRVQVTTLTGKSVWVRAAVFVVACGGIENARLLLSSNKQQPGGLGNGADLVGRYFMDHPRLMSGSIRFANEWARNKLYDSKFHYQNQAVSAGGTCISSQFMLSRDVQTENQLLNARVWFCSLFPGEGTESTEALVRMKQRMLRMDESGHKFSKDVLAILKNPWDAARFATARVFQPRSLISDVRMQAIVEPMPNRESRVMLSREADALGMRRVKVVWKLADEVKHTFDRMFQTMSDELTTQGIAQVKLDPPLVERDWPNTLVGTWHHMGTTRMHDSPNQGVVDRHCRVHGMSNLYVAGSSVFPTAGANFPTMTLVALAHRLADRLSSELSIPSSTASSADGRMAA